MSRKSFGGRHSAPPAAAAALPSARPFSGRILPVSYTHLDVYKRQLHEVLRVEVRARRVGRPGSFHDRQLLFIPERLQGVELRMEGEEAIEVDAVRLALRVAGRRDADGGTQIGIVLVSEGRDDAQAVGRSALEKDVYKRQARSNCGSASSRW